MNPIKSLLVGAVLLLGVAIAHGADADRLQLARDVIKASQADKMIDSLSGQIQQMVAAQMKAGAKDMDADKLARVQAAQKEVIALAMESAKTMMAKLDQVYADIYTESELRGMKAFFESEAGRSMIEKQPALMQRIMPMVTQMQQEMMPKVQAIMQRHMAAEPSGN